MSASMSWSEQARSGEGRKRFSLMGLLRTYLSDEDLYDMDRGLGETMTSQMRATGSVVMPPGDSVQRVRDPLSMETAQNFGDRALHALDRTDLYVDSDEPPSTNL